MKRFVCLLFSIVSVFTVTAQIKQEVISSAGGSKVRDNISINWTLGETIIPMFKSANNNLTLSGSFLQTVIITADREPGDISMKVSVFPNPSPEDVNIRFESPVDARVRISLYDSQGKEVKTGIIEQGESEHHFPLKDLAPGFYLLRLSKGEIVNVYTLIKTQ